MKSKRIIICILVSILTLAFFVLFLFVLTRMGFFGGNNSRDPLIKELHFEDDVVTGVYSDKSARHVFYTLNNNKLCAFDMISELSFEIEFDSEIVDFASDNNKTVFVALSNDEVILFDISNNDFEVFCKKTFNYSVKEIAYSGYSDEYICFVLLENDELYSFGKNYHNIISDVDSIDTYFSIPQLLSNDVKLINSSFYVRNDNSIVVFRNNSRSDNAVVEVAGDVDSIIDTSGEQYLLIDDNLWVLSGNDKVRLEKNLKNEHYEFGYHSTLYFDESNKGYFSGTCYGYYTTKGIPFVQDYYVEYIPDNYNYLPVFRGIVCYDEHTIICYAVVKPSNPEDCISEFFLRLFGNP